MSYTVRQQDGILWIEFRGTFKNHDLWRGGDEVDRIERAAAVVPHRIADLRPVERVEIDFNGIFTLVQMRRRLGFKNSFKSAIIATDVVHFGFARMFQTLNDHPQICIAIFGDEQSARSWIAIPDHRPPEQEWNPSPIEG